MRDIRQAVLDVLDRSTDEDQLIQDLQQIIAEDGDRAYPIILHVLAHLELESNEAAVCWDEILDHYQALKGLLARPLSLRTAICDYFCSIYKALRNPKVVEIHVFEKTLHASRYDGLTGLLNRPALDEALEREINRARRHDQDLSVLFLDLDRFKKVNDTYGHLAGDVALQKVSQTILKTIRAEDIAGRYGGEEMVVISPETRKTDAMRVGQRIRHKIAQTPIQFNGATFNLTISGGLAAYPVDAQSAKALLSSADQAVQKAKMAGRDTISLYSKDQRRYTRVAYDREIKVKKCGVDESQTLLARGRNLSEGGILFRNPHPFDIGTLLQFHIPRESQTPLRTIGSVVHVTSSGPHQYEIGSKIALPHN